MLGTVRVWAVELGPSSRLDEREGVLSLGDDSLRFAAMDDAGDLAIPLADVVKVRRLRGSPVLLIVHGRLGQERRTAFYFAQPPPLTAFLEGQAERTTLATLRNPRRKARRQNVGYLGVMNRTRKAQLVEWERSVRAAAQAARGG